MSIEKQAQALTAPIVTINPRSAQVIDIKAKSRPRLYGDHLLKGYITALNAPGGVGKSVFSMTMAAGLAVGRDLLGLGEVKPRKSLIINNEDGYNELELRLLGIAKAYRFTDEEKQLLPEMLKIQSGYHQQIKIAAHFENLVGPTVIQDELIGYCRANDIEALFVDPLVSLHDSPENDNVAMDAVIAILRVIAEKAGVGIYLSHHSKKGAQADSPDDNSRGASAIINGVRANYGLAKMTRDESKKFVLPEDAWPHMIRLDSGKRNYAANAADADWFELKSYPLEVTHWETDEPVTEWVGVPVSAHLQPKDRNQDGWTLEKVMKAIISTIESPFTKTGGSGEKLRLLLSDSDRPIGASTLNNRMKCFPGVTDPKRQVEVYGTRYWCWIEQNKAAQNRIEYHYAEV